MCSPWLTDKVRISACRAVELEMTKAGGNASGRCQLLMPRAYFVPHHQLVPGVGPGFRSASYHRHRVSLDCVMICSPPKNKPDCVFACRKRAKAKKLDSLFTAPNTVEWFFETTSKELYALNEWIYLPEIIGSRIRLKAHRKFPAYGYHDGFEFHAIVFLSGGVGLKPSRDPPSSSITPR